MLPHARALGLPYVEITADPDNIGSRRAIEKNGGVLVGEFRKPDSLGGGPCVRYRIDLGEPA
jgi:predicted acetyltransferase